jgi:hypothetical protein
LSSALRKISIARGAEEAVHETTTLPHDAVPSVAATLDGFDGTPRRVPTSLALVRSCRSRRRP